MRLPNAQERAFIEKCAPENTAEFIEKCRVYGDYLYETNKTFNLTRIPENDFWVKHVCDSLSLALFYPFPKTPRHLKMCDVGCGAGLPSIILAAAFPSLFVTAIDSTGKKAAFVARAAEAAGLPNLRAFQARANELCHKSDFRHAFQLVTARAVGTAEFLLRESSGLLSANGMLAVYRTPSQAEDEKKWFSNLKKAPVHEFSKSFFLPPAAENSAGTENDPAGERLFLFIRGLS